MLKLLVLTILILSTPISKANYIDIGHKNGLEVGALFKAYKAFYARVQKNEIGVGAGFRTGSYLLVASINKNDENYSVGAHAVYNDSKLVYSLDLNGGFNNELRVTVGAGYPFTEKISAYSTLSNDGLFVGLRRFF